MNWKFIFLPAILLSFCIVSTDAHFQTLIPSDDVSNGEISIEMSFTHPMENGPAMQMNKPKNFGVLHDGKKISLLEHIKEGKLDGKSTWKLGKFKFDNPGAWIFYVEPIPYWEASENKNIIHYTKVVVDAFGEGNSWDEMIGFPVEIKPLTRPYGLYAGNLFQGIVTHSGKAVPFAEVEIEYLNTKGKFKAPTDHHITQIVKADANGVFSYVMPKPGWYGFAALIDGEKSKSPDGKEVDTELGALIWIKAYPFD